MYFSYKAPVGLNYISLARNAELYILNIQQTKHIKTNYGKQSCVQNIIAIQFKYQNITVAKFEYFLRKCTKEKKIYFALHNK